MVWEKKSYNKYKNLIYEEEFKNGKRWHGKGKEYKCEQLIYSGGYLNSKRNGKVRIFFDDEKLEFEGKYLNEEKFKGSGNEVLDKGKLKYKGEYLNGEWNGKSIEFSSLNFKLIYKGNFLKVKWYGKCIGIIFCKTPITLFSCEKCINSCFQSESKSSCVSTDNCLYGDKDIEICSSCIDNYYLDYNDGKCKSNQEDNKFKYCTFVDNNICLKYSFWNDLGEDHK